MTDFLDSLVARSIGRDLPSAGETEVLVAPRIPSRFELQREPGQDLVSESWQQQAPANSVDLTERRHATESLAPVRQSTVAFPGDENQRHPPATSLSRIRDDFVDHTPAAMPSVLEPHVPSYSERVHVDPQMSARITALAREVRVLQSSQRGQETTLAETLASPKAIPTDSLPLNSSVLSEGFERPTYGERLSVSRVHEVPMMPLMPSREIQPEAMVAPSEQSKPTQVPLILHERTVSAPPRIVPEELPARTPAALPTVNVTIGRVEVKAMREPAPSAQRVERPRTPVMSLEQYLERRAAGGRT